MKVRKNIAFWVMFVVLVVINVAGQDTRGLKLIEGSKGNNGVRTALVIGNGNYAEMPLKNPPNDASDMAAALESLGFEVLSYIDLDQTGMKKAIREFGAKLRTNGGVGLFYYAGHGVQTKGVNYLIPVGAKVDTEEEVEYEAVEAGFVLAQWSLVQNGMNIVILDACRNNPFARSFRSAEKGLASIDAPSGTLLAYSTAPGSVASDGAGRNGLYTQELLKEIRTPGLSIEQVFKRVRISVRGATTDTQTPWEVSSLVGNFYFAENNRETSDAVATVASEPVNTEISRSANSSPATATIELAFWDSIKTSSDAANFNAYLKRYPSGIFVDLANNKLQAISESEAIEKAKQLEQEKAEEVAALTKSFKGEFGFRALVTYLSKYRGTLTVSPGRIFFSCEGNVGDNCKTGNEQLEFTCSSFSKSIAESGTLKEISYNGSTHRFNASLKADAAAALSAIRAVCTGK